MADNADHDSIILAAAIGHPIHDIARSHDLTVAEVRKIIDEIADWMLPDKHQRVAGVH
jgi:hypothetical protein